MKLYLKFALAALLSVLSLTAQASPIDVFATSFPDAYPTLDSINLVTGHVTPMGTVNWGGLINDIAQDPVSGALYGLSGANLFTINTSGSIGNVVPVATSGMNGSMETLAFDRYGDLYIGTQADLYKFNFGANRMTGAATHLGNYDANNTDPYLNGRGQNIRFNGDTLYAANTGSGGNTEIYTVSTNTGAATFVGVVTNQPALVLGNHGSHMYGSSVPAINGAGTQPDLLDFGPTLTTVMGNNPLGSGEIALVNYTVIGEFPQNQNFTEVGPLASVAAVPEPSSIMMLGLGALGIVAYRRKMAKA